MANDEDNEKTERATTASCTQCGKAAVVSYNGNNLCVEHHLMVQQATYLQISMLNTHLNRIEQDIDRGTGGILDYRAPINLSPSFARDLVYGRHA